MKGWLKSEGVRTVVCWLGSLYIRFVFLTSRFETHNGHIPAEFWEKDQPFILAFWHGRLLMMPHIWSKKHKIHMLISAHRDGQLISKTVSHFGIETIEGSKNKQGAEALRTMLKTLKSGQSIGITPDGPRGPRMRASDGVVSVAKLSGLPVIPATVATTRRKHLKSWDRFMVALPFSKGYLLWGEPIYVDRKTPKDDMENVRLLIETRMNELCAKADHLSHHPAIEPERLGP